MGDAAAQNCDDFGWGPVGPIDHTLVAETAQSEYYGYGRAWSRSSEYTLRGDARSLYLVLTVEGGFEFTVDGDTVTTQPGELIFLDGRDGSAARTRMETARFVWFLRPTVLDPRRSRFALNEPIDTSNPPMQSLVSMTNALLNAGDDLPATTQGHIGRAAEHLIAAALNERPVASETAAMHRDGLFTTAQLLIDRHFRDPVFGVNELARQLASSTSHVHEIFSSMGTTPRRELERRRLSEVAALQKASPTLEQIVQDSGFTTMRQYRAAVARQGRRPRSEENPSG